jgi:hypothetical protein
MILNLWNHKNPIFSRSILLNLAVSLLKHCNSVHKASTCSYSYSVLHSESQQLSSFDKTVHTSPLLYQLNTYFFCKKRGWIVRATYSTGSTAQSSTRLKYVPFITNEQRAADFYWQSYTSSATQ